VTQTGKTTRAQRLAMPLARAVVKDLAISHGGCIRPIQLRRTDLTTGQTEPVLVPCGHTLAPVCPACAERARNLRAAQCREGWHLEDEPDPEPDSATDGQEWWIEMRAEQQARRDHAEASGEGTEDLDELLAELDEEINRAGMRGKVAASRPRRHRSTRRRQDAPPLPSRKVDPRTVGKTYTAPDGKTFRPSLFLTLTCRSYGPVTSDGTPVNPDAYDYAAAARDALHFAALFDRFIQNLRRYTGYDIQYFAAIEPQKRLAPHVHMAMRGTIARRELREVIAATYHQVWWPSTRTVAFDGDHVPVWDEDAGTYLDPETGEVLPTWDQALDAIGDADEPSHVARFGDRFDAQGVLSGSKDAGRCIGLPDQVPDQAARRLPRARRRRPSSARRTARRGPAVRTLLADVCELAALRHPAQEPQAGHAARLLQGQGAPPRVPRLRRPPRAHLAQVVRQDPRRPPRRPQELADSDARSSGSRPRPLRLGTRQPRRPRPHARPATAAARRRRPDALATGARPGPPTRPRAARRSFGNWEGGMNERIRAAMAQQLLSVEAAAERLDTKPRFIRRLIAERRMEFVRVGRHVRISESALADFIEAGRVEPVSRRPRGRAA
jgi:excisionase family DNA binding protein